MAEPHANPEVFNAAAGNWRGIHVPALPAPAVEVEFIDAAELAPVDSRGIPALRLAAQQAVDSYVVTLPTDGTPPAINVVRPTTNAASDAHLAIPAHRLAKDFGDEEIVNLANSLGSSELPTTEIDVEGKFVNIKLDTAEVADKVLGDIFELGDSYGANNEGDGKLVVMDVSSPNIAKQMHLGHLRSTVIGESIRRILQFNGFNVVRDNHVGDWGTQFGLLGRAVELWGDEVKDYLESDSPTEQIKGLLQLYVKINRQIAEEKEVSPDGSSELENAGREWFVKLEAGDPDAIDFWHKSSELSMLEFDEVYDKLGVEFEYILGESVYEPSNQSVIAKFKEAGLTFVDGKGVVKVTPSKKKGDALGIQKPDGTSLYGTRDLATIAARMYWFNPERIIYVVGGDQNEYFANVFDAMRQYMGPDGDQLDLVHVSFGAVELPEGPMSTRKGTVVPLRDVIGILEDRVREKVASNMETRGNQLEPQEVEKIVGQVAVGSIIYYDLKGATKRKIIYDADEITSFEGNSGASLQYTAARINSLLKNADYGQGVSPVVDVTAVEEAASSPENKLIETLGYFPDFVKLAAERYEPSVISEYLVQVASQYNSLLERTRILDHPDLAKRRLLLDISAATKQVLGNGLRLLNIPVPERM